MDGIVLARPTELQMLATLAYGPGFLSQLYHV